MWASSNTQCATRPAAQPPQPRPGVVKQVRGATYPPLTEPPPSGSPLPSSGSAGGAIQSAIAAVMSASPCAKSSSSVPSAAPVSSQTRESLSSHALSRAPAARAPVSRASAARAPAARAPAVLAASLADSHGAPVARRSDASAGAPAASISHHHAAPTRSTSLSTSLLLSPDEQRLRKFNLLLEKEVCILSHILCHIISHFPMLVPHATPHVPYTSSDSSSRSPGH